jgi:hypothetical protein
MEVREELPRGGRLDGFAETRIRLFGQMFEWGMAILTIDLAARNWRSGATAPDDALRRSRLDIRAVSSIPLPI